MEQHFINKSKLKYIDPHIHMTSRTTDDYVNMKESGVVALIEPSFWLGQPRTNVGSFIDYFSSLVGWECFRASQFGIHHFCTIGLNAKEANDGSLAKEVITLIPRYAGKENVVAIGEIGFDEINAAEEKALREQIEIAKNLKLPILIHTPHRNKKQGTIRTMAILEEHKINPKDVIIDHNNEETANDVLKKDYWTAFTIYPYTKMDPKRMVAIVKKYGSEQIIVNSSADWGISDPLSVPKTANLMYEEKVPLKDIELSCFKNAILAYGKNGLMTPEKLLKPIKNTPPYSKKMSSILRGQKEDILNNRSK